MGFFKFFSEHVLGNIPAAIKGIDAGMEEFEKALANDGVVDEHEQARIGSAVANVIAREKGWPVRIKAPLEFTENPPQEAGFYWAKFSLIQDGAPTVVDVQVDEHGGVMFTAPGTDMVFTHEDIDGDTEWAGPLQCPMNSEQ